MGVRRPSDARARGGIEALSLLSGWTDWYAGAVALTCRWMAAAPLRTSRGGGLVRSPATRRRVLAYEELIEEEYLAAQDLEQRRPDLAARPGWCEGVRATLRWAWRAEGPPPLELPATADARRPRSHLGLIERVDVLVVGALVGARLVDVVVGLVPRLPLGELVGAVLLFLARVHLLARPHLGEGSVGALDGC